MKRTSPNETRTTIAQTHAPHSPKMVIVKRKHENNQKMRKPERITKRRKNKSMNSFVLNDSCSQKII